MRRLREKKRVSYNDVDDDDDDDGDDDEEEEEVQEYSEQPGTSTQCTHIQRTPGKRRSLLDHSDLHLLPVTCGDKEGVLDIEKLARGEACIEYDRCWFAPPAFEDFGGRGVSKKWKTSIFFDDEPLQLLFEQGHLKTPGFKRRAAGKKRKKTPSPNSKSERSSDESEEDVEVDDDEDEDCHGGNAAEELALETEGEEEKREGDEDGGEDKDSGGDRQKEDEYKIPKVKMEVEDTPVAADDDNDNNSLEGEKNPWYIIPGYEEIGEKSGAKQRSCLKIPVKRLSGVRIELFPARCPEHPAPEHKEIIDSQEEKEDGELETEQCGEQVKEEKRREAGSEMERGQSSRGEDHDNANSQHVYMSGSEGSGPFGATGNPNGEQPSESETTTNLLLPIFKNRCLPSSVTNSSPSVSHCSIQFPRNPKKKTHSFRRKKTLSLSRNQGCLGRDKSLDRRRETRETAMIHILQNISDSQQKIIRALEQLCSKQDTVIKLLQKQR